MAGPEMPGDLFLDQVLRVGAVWSVADQAGPPVVLLPDGRRAMPFWSSPSRVARVRRMVPDYARLGQVRVPLGVWREQWLPGLQRDDLLVGVDWAGSPLTGGVLPPDVVERHLLQRASS